MIDFFLCSYFVMKEKNRSRCSFPPINQYSFFRPDNQTCQPTNGRNVNLHLTSYRMRQGEGGVDCKLKLFVLCHHPKKNITKRSPLIASKHLAITKTKITKKGFVTKAQLKEEHMVYEWVLTIVQKKHRRER